MYWIKLFFTTLAFLSWIPVPKWGITGDSLHRMGIFFPVVGGLLGGVAACVLVGASIYFPYPVSVALALLCYGLVTGMFHEDAVADVADGMGGHDPQKIIAIMRDSSVGTYGSFALISLYVLRYAALSVVSPEMAVRNLVAFAAVSRLSGVLFLTMAKPGDIPEESLGRTVLYSNRWGSFLVGLVFAAVITVLAMPGNVFVVPVVIVCVPVLARIYFLRRIGLVTGDCAGFVILVTETVLLVLATVQ